MAPKAGSRQQITLNSRKYKVVDYSVDEVAPLAQQIMNDISTGQRSYKYETASRWQTWHQGFGLGEIRDATDAGRYHYSQNVDARFRGQLILGAATQTAAFSANAEAKVQFVEYNGNDYAVGARYVHIFNQGTGQWDLSKDMGASAAAVKGCAAVYGDYLVVGAGGSVDYWRLFTDGTWDQPASGIKAQLMALVGNTLWRTFNANQLSSSTNFTTWASAVGVGESRHTATGLTDYNGNPLTGKPEGLFEYDGTKVSNRLPELAARPSSTNCSGMKPSRGKLYIPVGPYLWQYTADAVQTEGKPTRSAEALAAGITRESSSEVRGTIPDLWADVDFLWGVFAAQSGNYYLIAYDYNPVAGQGWHQVVKTGTTSVTALGRFQPSSGNPRLFYSEGTTIKYIVLPANAQNPYVDSNYVYATTGDIYLPVEADTFDDVTKSYLAVRLVADNLLAGLRYVDIYYSIDGGTEVSLGRVDSSGLTEVLFPSSTTGKRMRIRFTLTTNDTSQTPRVLPSSRHYKLRFDRKQYWKCGLVLARAALPNVMRQALDQLKDLETARTSQAPVSLVDPDGRSYTVFVESVGQPKRDDDVGGDQVITSQVELLEWRATVASVAAVTSATVDSLALWGPMPDVVGLAGIPIV